MFKGLKMDLQQRRQLFEQEVRSDQLCTLETKYQKLFGVSNSAKIIEGGVQLGVVNLESVKDASTEGFVFACFLAFPPEDEVYFAVFVKTDKADLIARLEEMRARGQIETTGSDEQQELKYGTRNNNTAVYLASDGKLYLRNKGFWDSLNFDLSSVGPGIEVDKINVALYPDEPSVRRSMLAREFVGYLGKFVGRNKVHEIAPWPGQSDVRPEMSRLPHTLVIQDIEQHIEAMGGFYIDNLIRRYHTALNHNPKKHFVVLAGLSGTGKTNLALQYAYAVHGVLNASERDPFLFVCPVRPEWTDPTGLIGYYDVLSDRYVVPPFLEAVLVANAHPDTPVFVCLDEMNLARVEYYFSDILSSIETGQPLQLHSNSVPLEGSSGGEIRAEAPLPTNLYITGTINIDETTNPLSDKVLDRAMLIDMSVVGMEGYLDSLSVKESGLASSIMQCKEVFLGLERILAAESQGFGYRTVREALLYYKFAIEQLQADSQSTLDELLVQKFLVKLRGTEDQREMLDSLSILLAGYPRASNIISEAGKDLDSMGSFQASR
ncbi:unnamed protein product [Ectocarpus sp. 12 AP-2014]